MTITILVVVAVLLVAVGCGAAIWLVRQRRKAVGNIKPAEETTTGEAFSFRWRYIIFPIVVFVISIVLTAAFYPRLATEVAYHFTFGGSPDKWLSREMSAVLALAPQFLLTLLAAGIVWGLTKMRLLSSPTGVTWIKPQSILRLMGNMIGLPQLILCFAMLDIFYYNLYQTHIMPVWIFAVIIMGLGGIVLGVFFVQAVRRAIEGMNRVSGKDV